MIVGESVGWAKARKRRTRRVGGEVRGRIEICKRGYDDVARFIFPTTPA